MNYNNTMNDQETTEKDCTQLLALDINDFITAVYRELLEREPDNEGFTKYIRLIYQGMPREEIIYQIASSPEFTEKYKIKDFKKYEKKHKKFIIKTKLKKLPIIGWFIKLTHIPDILSTLQMIEADFHINKLANFNAMNEIITWAKNNMINILENLEGSNKILEWAKNNTLNILDNLDGSNKILEWTKNNTLDILDNLDATKEIVKEKFDSTAKIVKEEIDSTTEVVKKNIDKLPKTDEIMPRFDSLSYLMDVQRIINKGLTPTYGLESIQAELISLLNDKTDEFEAYNQLPIEHLVKYAEGKTIAAAYYSNLISDYTVDRKLNVIEAAGIEPALLPNICQGKDTLIIANPALSALVLTSPILLREIAQKLNRNLVLVVHAASYPISVIWGGFSFIENEEDNIYKWAQGGLGNWRIRIYNNLSRPVEAKLKWVSDSLCDTGELTASCCGKTINVDLCNHEEVNFIVILQPGGNNLNFNFSGQAKLPEQDKRILAFRIINFSCNIDDMNIDQDYLYNKNNIQYNISFLSDDYIRQTLHQNGFYDVTSTAYANHGFSSREVEKTRYKYPFEYLIVNRAERYSIAPDEIVCYNAYRLRRTDTL